MNAKEILQKGLEELGISFSDKDIKAFILFLQELKKWNRAYNLTALKSDRDIIIKHFLDSLLYLKAIPEGRLRLADAGSGAGFPGIPLKLIRPEIELTLIESSRKKTSFLRNMIRKLELESVNVLQERIENIGAGYAGSFDVMVSRATFSIMEFMNAACLYLNKDGALIMNKGPKVEDELRELEYHKINPGSVKEIISLPLPLTETQRNIIIIKC